MVAIFLLIFALVLLVLIIAGVPVSQKALNILFPDPGYSCYLIGEWLGESYFGEVSRVQLPYFSFPLVLD